MSNKTLKEFIKNTILKGDPTLESEINLLFTYNIEYTCSNSLFIFSAFTLIGAENSISYNLEYTNILPNLFRQCWSNYTPLPLPNSCPIFYYTNISLIYRPKLIDEKIIKAFFYYGLSDEIKNSQEIIPLYDKLSQYKKNIITINSSKYYSILSIIFNIYDKKSILLKFFNFTTYLNNVVTNFTYNKVSNNYLIPWYCLSNCSCSSGILSNITTNNFINTLPLDTSDFIFINNLIINRLYTYSIIAVIKNFNEVFTDIYQQIYSFLTNGKYCLKPYMSTSLTPEVLEKYNNYFKNLESL
jgi:hypothetical protein